MGAVFSSSSVDCPPPPYTDPTRHLDALESGDMSFHECVVITVHPTRPLTPIPEEDPADCFCEDTDCVTGWCFRHAMFSSPHCD